MLLEILTMIGIHEADKILNTGVGKNDADEWGVYLDGNGNYRLKKDGKWVIYTFNEYGEKIIKYVKSGNVAVNVDEMESNSRRADAINNNRMFYMYRPERNNMKPTHRRGNDNIEGSRYKNIKDDKLYVQRRIEYYDKNNNEYYNGIYYMNMNYNFLCPSEETMSNDKKKYPESYNEIHKKIINMLNIQSINFSSSEYFSSHPYNSQYAYIHIGDSDNYRYVHRQLARTDR